MRHYPWYGEEECSARRSHVKRGRFGDEFQGLLTITS